MVSHDEIVAPHLYADEVRLHAMFAHLRRNEPLRWTEPRQYRPFWAVAKHADILEIETNNEAFIAGPRNRLLTVDEENRVRAKTGGAPLMRSLPTMDNPDHRKYRMLTRDWFMPSNLKRLESRLTDLAREYVKKLRVAGGELDFVKEISVWFPLRVIMMILGIPEKDGAMMHRLTGELFSPHDPDTARKTDGHAVAEAGAEFFAYFSDLLAQRRRDPRDDLLTVIANAKVDGEGIDDNIALAYCVSITAAGHETTAAALAGGVHAFVGAPDQFQRLKRDPGLLGSAVDEILRFVSPVRNFVRTATRDYPLRGKVIRAGDAVLLLFPSANRDEDVFEAPNQFQIDRARNPHLAFGAGPHICLGLLLAKMELRHFFQEFVAQVEHVELSEPASWLQANFLGGPKAMPVKCRFVSTSQAQVFANQ